MSYFSYVGRLLSNVKGFYNEINSATLTGAIDVVIVQQEDGSYLCSPFHVRFGKLGVLHSREKIVDIEINGEPVDLHMKLGETGEAFFVKEVEDEAIQEIPPYLATSPIPSTADLMEQGVRELRKEAQKSEREEITDQKEALKADQAPSQSHTNQPDKASGVSKTDSSSSKPETKQSKVPPNKQVSQLSKSSKSNKKSPLTKDNSKDSLGDSDNSSKESGSRDTTPKAKRRENKPSAEELTKSKRRKKKKMPYKKGNSRLSAKSAPEGEIFDMDVTSDEEELRPLPALPNMVKSASLPLAEEDRMDRTNMWADSQFEAHLHPFSDTDITPVGSPSGTRSPSPSCKSDTECERQRQEETEVEHLLPPPDTLWEWGQLPQPLPSPSQDSPSTVKDEPVPASRSPQGPDSAVKPQAQDSGGLFYFMRKTKAIRHKPEEEGIYLEDLTKEEMDPEVAKLYFPKSSFHFMSIKEKEEDTESGRGASLPQSPHSVEGAIGGPPASYLMSEVRHLGEVSLSLCGGLVDMEGQISMENFMQSVVTFDTLCDDLSLVQHPDLVVRIGDKFYNWATAAPQILSLVAFQKYLPESAVQNLIKEHMPKKKGKKTGMTSWFSWRRAPPDETQTTTAYLTTTTTLQQSAIASSSDGTVVVPATTSKSGDVTSVTAAEVSTVTAVPMPISEATTISKTLPSMNAESNATSAPVAKIAVNATVSVGAVAPVVSSAAPVVNSAAPVVSVATPAVSVAAPAVSVARPVVSVATSAVKVAMPAVSISTPSCSNAVIMSTTVTVAANDEASPISAAVVTDKVPILKNSATEIVTEVVVQSSKKLQSEALLSDVPPSPASSAPGSPKKPSHEATKRLKGEDSSENETDSSEKSLSRTEVQSISSESADIPSKKYQKSLRLSSNEIVKLNLHEGQNEITFSVTTQYQGTSRCTSHIYLWRYDDKIVISDIDGTITKSDVLGQILPILGRDWSQSGVAELYTKISNNGYKFMYLSARAIGQSKVTKDLLRNIRQDNLVLPDGPLMLSPISLISAFHREVIEKKPEEFKISCMSDIGQLFPQNQRPFYAGFGNKINDVYAYKALDIPFSRIFTINHKGELRHEKILTFQSSYSKLVDVVDHFFPPLQRIVFGKTILHSELLVPNEFRSVSYWREPLPEVSLQGLLEVKVTETKVAAKQSDVEKKKQPKV